MLHYEPNPVMKEHLNVLSTDEQISHKASLPHYDLDIDIITKMYQRISIMKSSELVMINCKVFLTTALLKTSVRAKYCRLQTSKEGTVKNKL